MQPCPRILEWPTQRPPDGSHWREDGTCSYCGSISSETFLKAVEDGQEVIPTDKSYKAYVRLPDKEQSKFYFQHLTPEERSKFAMLWLDKKFNLAWPGHFYTLPYFMGPR